MNLLLAELARSGGAAHVDELAAASSTSTCRRARASGLVVPVGAGLVVDAELGRLLVAQPPPPAWSAESDDEVSDDWRRFLLARHVVARGRRAALTLRCAAAHHGWATLTEPDAVELAVPTERRRRSVPTDWRVHVARRTLPDADLVEGVTNPLLTVLHCAESCSWPEALAVADSALRSGLVGAQELRSAAHAWGRGRRPQVIRVATHADGGAANPFESALRAALVDVVGLRLVTQYEIREGGFSARVDLADPRLGLVVEADSYAFHGSAEAHEADCARYDELVGLGWAVLRFTFHQVMTDLGWVRETVQATVWGLQRGASPVVGVRDRGVRLDASALSTPVLRRSA